VVAVVGAAHVDGIARQWSLQQSRSREEAADLFKLVQMQVPQDMSLQQLRYNNFTVLVEVSIATLL
jgi:pheromone shutdown protein TraB